MVSWHLSTYYSIKYVFLCVCVCVCASNKCEQRNLKHTSPPSRLGLILQSAHWAVLLWGKKKASHFSKITHLHRKKSSFHLSAVCCRSSACRILFDLRVVQLFGGPGFTCGSSCSLLQTMIMQIDSAPHAASEACVYVCRRACVCVSSTHTSDCRRKGQQPDMVIMFVPCPTHQPAPVSRHREDDGAARTVAAHLSPRRPRKRKGVTALAAVLVQAPACWQPPPVSRHCRSSVIKPWWFFFFTQLRPPLLLSPVVSAWWERSNAGKQASLAALRRKRRPDKWRNNNFWRESPRRRGNGDRSERSWGRGEPSVGPCDQ